MSRTKQDDRNEFYSKMSKNFGHAGVEAATALMLLARKAERYNEMACNYGLTDRQEKTMLKVDAQARAIATQLGATLKTNGDPRGYAFKIQLPDGSYNTWGGQEDGWGIPSA